MADRQQLLQIDGVTFAASDVLTVGPVFEDPLNTPNYKYGFWITMRMGTENVKWRGEKFQENDRFPEWKRDAFLIATNARNAVIQAVWPNGNVNVIDAGLEVQS
jgi:hypothetical protein